MLITLNIYEKSNLQKPRIRLNVCNICLFILMETDEFKVSSIF